MRNAVNKWSRADVRVRVRRGVVRIEVKQPGIRAVVPVAPDLENAPARVIVRGRQKTSTQSVDSPTVIIPPPEAVQGISGENNEMRYFENSINWGLRPQAPGIRSRLSPEARCRPKAPGAAAPGPPLGVEKESRADARVRVRRGVVRIEAKQPGIRAVVPVAPD